jgi:hypothetical protein
MSNPMNYGLWIVYGIYIHTYLYIYNINIHIHIYIYIYDQSLRCCRDGLNGDSWPKNKIKTFAERGKRLQFDVDTASTISR